MAEMPRACLVCGSESIGTRGPFVSEKHGSELTLAVCADCGHATTTQMRDETTNLRLQRDAFDDAAARFDLRRVRRSTRWPRRTAMVALETYRIAGKRGKALDIGCGSGSWLATLGDTWEKHGIELSSKAAEIARAVSGADVFCGDFQDYDAPMASFDLITAFAVIEHLSDPRSLVRWAHEHLKPGGALVLMTGDRESMFARHRGEQWPLYWPRTHLHFFSARSLRLLLSQEGFRVVREEWRGSSGDSLVAHLSACAREVLGRVTTPDFDLLYVFAYAGCAPCEEVWSVG